MVQCPKCHLWYYEFTGHVCQPSLFGQQTYYSSPICNCQALLLVPVLVRIEELLKKIAPANITSGCNLTEPRLLMECNDHKTDHCPIMESLLCKCGDKPCNIDFANCIKL